MDVSVMTLEGFFLTDYERLRRENEELRTKLDAATPSGFGVFDLGHQSDMVKVELCARNLLYNTNYDGIDLESISKASQMTDEELWEWSSEKHMHKDRWYSPFQPITTEYHKFQYTLRIVETRHDRTFVTDGTDSDNDEGRLFPIKDWEGEECLEVWQRVERLDYIKRQALEQLRDNLKYAKAQLEKED